MNLIIRTLFETTAFVGFSALVIFTLTYII